MKGIHGYVSSRQPSGQLLCEQNVGQLGLGVSADNVISSSQMRVGKIDPPDLMGAGRNIDDTGRRCLLKGVEEEEG
ncbi:hypothetical protein D3C73_1437230 [compost metagenome]